MVNRGLRTLGLVGLSLLVFTGYWLLRVVGFGEPVPLLHVLLFWGLAGALVVVVRCWPSKD
jgi:hypothetical protein